MGGAREGYLGPAALCAILNSVKYIAAIVLVFGLAILPGAMARADQSDSRLTALFDQLKRAPDPDAARLVESTIWNIWVEVEDNAANLLLSDGIAAMARGDLRTALRKFDQIVAIAPGFAEGWNKRATVHYFLGNFDESLADIDKTLALEPRHFGALSGRGLVYLQLEEEELALDSFEAALDVYPLALGANQNAKILRGRLGRRDI